MKIVFFGTSWVGTKILETLSNTHEVLAVVTRQDAPVGRRQVLTPSPIAVLATKLGLPVLKPEKVKGNSEFIQTMSKLGADVFIVVSYGKILPKELIYLPPLKTLNVHFSLLPHYRGAAPIQAALLAGDEVSGTTIFILDELLDHGPILAQEKVEVSQDDTFTTLAEKMATESLRMLLELLPDYQQGLITPKEQDHSKATQAPMIKKQDGQISWAKSAREIYNMHRAFIEWPGIFTFFDGKLLKILSCEVASDSAASNAVSGTVLAEGAVACGDGSVLQLLQLQLEGKTPVNIHQFLNGHTTFVGSKLA